MAKCDPECGRTGMLDKATGKRMMISQGGKFPKDLLHPMCDDCIKNESSEATDSILFGGDQTLLDKHKEYEGAKEKFKKLSN